jgi:D-glycero-alpha-D-manno-heptose-7-phosphate kinase
MILAKAPLRVSFFGGGSDIPTHFLKWGGSTISMAIDKYVYVIVMPTPHNYIKVSYSKQECVYNVDDLQNDIIKNALKFFGIKSNIEINTFADIPTVGTGLAGSSAFTCALVKALSALIGNEYHDPYDIAKIACHIEINMCGWNIGMQDQYAAAFGGMNYIQYSDKNILVHKMNVNQIDEYMLLIPTNIQRHASKVLDNVNFSDKATCIWSLSDIADDEYKNIPSLCQYGKLLEKSWGLKKQMDSGISNPEIDSMYDKCMNHGAVGAKLLGAGGGGYMLALTEDRAKIKEAFSDRVCLNVSVSHEGTKIVYRE